MVRHSSSGHKNGEGTSTNNNIYPQGHSMNPIYIDEEETSDEESDSEEVEEEDIDEESDSEEIEEEQEEEDIDEGGEENEEDVDYEEDSNSEHGETNNLMAIENNSNRPSLIPPLHAPSASNGTLARMCVTNMLDCSICSKPLSPPVFQCLNGHIITCAICSRTVKRKCSMCSCPIAHTRCRAIESVLESMKIACKNAKYGCKELVKYGDKQTHEKTCVFQRCFCPQIGCNHANNYRDLTFHFRMTHMLAEPPFTYDEVFDTELRCEEGTVVLQALTDGILFVIKNKIGRHWNTVTLCHIGPSSLNLEFPFELYVMPQQGRRNPRLFRSKAKNVQDHNYGLPSSCFLVVPFEFFQPSGRLALKIRIHKRLLYTP